MQSIEMLFLMQKSDWFCAYGYKWFNKYIGIHMKYCFYATQLKYQWNVYA